MNKINRGCEWPIGHPDESNFHFCMEERFGDIPYCIKHCPVAYIVPDKDEEATDNKAAISIQNI